MKRLSGDNKDDYSKDDDFDKKYKDNKEISLLDTLIDEDYERSRNKKFKKFPYKGNKDITLLDRRYDKPKIKIPKLNSSTNNVIIKKKFSIKHFFFKHS